MPQPTRALARLAGALLIAAGLAGCAGAAPAPTSAPPSSLSDPFAYCAAVGTADAPDARYQGEPLPASVAQAMVRQGVVSADAPPEFVRLAVWRCMGGRLLVCHPGANIPCGEKADTSQAPTAAMGDFCRESPAAEIIPAAVTGHATVYEWGCRDGKPAALRQALQVDAQGYVTEFWTALTAS